MKVLITGSSGSLGRMLIKYLIEKNINVIGVDIRKSTEFISEKKFKFYKCCITENEKLKSIFAEEKPTNVVHLACTLNRVRNRKREFEIDITG
jgi:nucleoside-diphosphate-sugar epimerase